MARVIVRQCALAILGAFLLCSCGSDDDGDGATLSGTITKHDIWYSEDSSVLAVQGATVSLKQSAITKRSETTDAAGAYRIEEIDPGTYDVEASVTPNFFDHICYPNVYSVSGAPQYDLNGAGLTDIDAADYALTSTTDGTYTITYGSLTFASDDSVTLDFRVYGY